MSLLWMLDDFGEIVYASAHSLCEVCDWIKIMARHIFIVHYTCRLNCVCQCFVACVLYFDVAQLL